MTRKKRADGGKKATIVVANEADDLKGALKHLGGSRSDDWNNILANQAINTLWLKHSDEETRDQQYDATLFALIGIGPRDELEGMIAAQLLAAHNAAMECYRRAMLAEQTFEARRENLEPGEQAFAHLCGPARRAQPPPRQGPAEGHSGARARPFWWTGDCRSRRARA
jgi:hypothetical protein